ncbi:MAG: mechanosensitive ion channel [Prevotella sp.]|nr:mechanosensitive ion channel [Prevotella sp.]
MNKKLLTLFLSICLFSLPIWAIVSGRSLTKTLQELCTELQTACMQRKDAQKRFNEDYGRQHQRMVDVIKNSNELSILLYSQEQAMTFDLAYALKKVTVEYEEFNKDRRPYDHIVSSLDLEIDRYGRLIEALRRLPPMKKEIETKILPDSLLYHNDSIDVHISDEASSLEKEVISIATKDTHSTPFILDKKGEIYRDSCIRYASELLKMNADNRAIVIADSTHYQEAFWRMKEAYDYAEARYQELEKYVFSEGQTPFLEIMTNPSYYWNKVLVDLHEQYDFDELFGDTAKSNDTVDTHKDKNKNNNSNKSDNLKSLSSKGENALLVFGCAIQLIFLAVFWITTFLILWLIRRFIKPKRFIPQKKLLLFSVLTGTILYFMTIGLLWKGDEYFQLGVKHINTLLWLLVAISGSLLLRVKPEQIRHGFQLYSPVFQIALIIIICRITFTPDRLMTFLFPPILFLVVLRQLFFCIKEHGRATSIDSTLGWISLVIYLIALVVSFLGFTFMSLLILIWWYFQLAALLTIVCISDLLNRYKERWLDKRVAAMRKRITYVTGADRESLLFGATWFHDFIRQVGITALVLLSLPLCVRLSLNVFDFNDLYVKFYCNPFVLLTDNNGIETLRISIRSIIYLLILLLALRYVNKAIHTIWRYFRYAVFMRKHNRSTIRANEINLSLANSIISIVIWMGYIIVVVAVWQIPTGSLGLIAGGLSAGIGIALKDIINNFIYGIQIMGGRLRVGDWIECDGVRGQVTAINYQCVQVETIEGTEMSFLNSSLFGKNFNNLTRNNSYELTKIIVGVAYGTDVNRVRKVLVEAMQEMRTKDRYGREIVDPKYGVYVVVENMSDSAVDIAVKQYVLVAERIGYVDRSKEIIYKALNDAGIVIAFPQCDVHLVSPV